MRNMTWMHQSCTWSIPIFPCDWKFEILIWFNFFKCRHKFIGDVEEPRHLEGEPKVAQVNRVKYTYVWVSNLRKDIYVCEQKVYETTEHMAQEN